MPIDVEFQQYPQGSSPPVVRVTDEEKIGAGWVSAARMSQWLHFLQNNFSGPAEDLCQAAAHCLLTMLSAKQTKDGIKVKCDSAYFEVPSPAWQPQIEKNPFGHVDIIFESQIIGVYRLRVSPQRTIPLHVHRQMVESELILTDGLLLQGQRVPSGQCQKWPKEFAHIYHNPTTTEQSILCIDQPAFIPTDEVEVDAEAQHIMALDVKHIRHYW